MKGFILYVLNMPDPTPSCEPGSSQIDLDQIIDKKHCEIILQQLKDLAHPVRLRMIELLRYQGGELCVCEFEKHFDLKQPTISHHLKILRAAHLIQSRNVGTWVHHSIIPESFVALGEWVEHLGPLSTLL